MDCSAATCATASRNLRREPPFGCCRRQAASLSFQQWQLASCASDLHEVELAAQGVVDQAVAGKVVGVLGEIDTGKEGSGCPGKER